MNNDYEQGRRQGVTTENFSRGPQAKGGQYEEESPSEEERIASKEESPSEED